MTTMKSCGLAVEQAVPAAERAVVVGQVAAPEVAARVAAAGSALVVLAVVVELAVRAVVEPVELEAVARVPVAAQRGLAEPAAAPQRAATF